MVSIRLLNIGHSETHLALVLIGSVFVEFADGVTAAELPLMPTWLSTLICHKAALTYLLRGNELIACQNN